MTTEHKYPRVMKMKWSKFIDKSLTRPAAGHWSDMALAPVDTFVLLFCEANRPYSFYQGQAIGICLKHKLSRDDPYAQQHRWFMVGTADKTGIFNYTKCNPHWWMPFPMSPPERPNA